MAFGAALKRRRESIPRYLAFVAIGAGALVAINGLAYLFGVIKIQDKVVAETKQHHCDHPRTGRFERRICKNWQLEYASGFLAWFFGMVQVGAGIAGLLLVSKLKKRWFIYVIGYFVNGLLMLMPAAFTIDVYRERKEYCEDLIQLAEELPCAGCPARAMNNKMPTEDELRKLAACAFRHQGNPSDLQLADAFVIFYFMWLVIDIAFSFGSAIILIFWWKGFKVNVSVSNANSAAQGDAVQPGYAQMPGTNGQGMAMAPVARESISGNQIAPPPPEGN